MLQFVLYISCYFVGLFLWDKQPGPKMPIRVEVLMDWVHVGSMEDLDHVSTPMVLSGT